MNILKKQGVAWVITIVMIVAAIGIGRAKAPAAQYPVTQEPVVVQPDSADQVDSFYVYDEAGVLSQRTEEKLTQRNLGLYQDLDVLIAVVTTNYGRDDLYNYALDYGDSVGLGSMDFIVVLDISGENYWLVQGAGLVDRFTDDDCGDYAWDYMESYFAAGDYDGAVLTLTEALENWYRVNY